MRRSMLSSLEHGDALSWELVLACMHALIGTRALNPRADRSWERDTLLLPPQSITLIDFAWAGAQEPNGSLDRPDEWLNYRRGAANEYR